MHFINSFVSDLCGHVLAEELNYVRAYAIYNSGRPSLVIIIIYTSMSRSSEDAPNITNQK